MAQYIVGEKNCSFNKLIICIVTNKNKPQLRTKWSMVAAHLDIPDKDDIQYGIDYRRQDIDWAVEKMLHSYRSSKSTNATLDKLIKAFDDNHAFDIGDCLRKEFGIPKVMANEKKIPQNDAKPLQQVGNESGVGVTGNVPPVNDIVDGGCLGKPKPRTEYPELWNYDKKNLIRGNIVAPAVDKTLIEGQYYKLTPDGKRYALIINIVQYEWSLRKGAIYDSCNLIKLFSDLEYQVEHETDQKEDFTKIRIDNINKNFKAKCIRDRVESFVIFVGAHGQYGRICLPTDKSIKNGSIDLYDDIVYKMSSVPEPGTLESQQHPDWAEIPKIFIISACRERPRDGPKPVDNAMVCYSCLPNAYSYRDPNGGTIYVKVFTKTMLEEARQSDFEEILKTVEDKVWEKGERQMPNYDAFGFKKLFFDLIF